MSPTAPALSSLLPLSLVSVVSAGAPVTDGLTELRLFHFHRFALDLQSVSRVAQEPTWYYEKETRRLEWRA